METTPKAPDVNEKKLFMTYNLNKHNKKKNLRHIESSKLMHQEEKVTIRLLYSASV